MLSSNYSTCYVLFYINIDDSARCSSVSTTNYFSTTINIVQKPQPQPLRGGHMLTISSSHAFVSLPFCSSLLFFPSFSRLPSSSGATIFERRGGGHEAPKRTQELKYNTRLVTIYGIHGNIYCINILCYLFSSQ